MDEKTNVIRLLTQKKIKFQSYHLDISEAVSGVEMAAMLKQNPAQVFPGRNVPEVQDNRTDSG